MRVKYWESADCDVTKVSRFTPPVWSRCLGPFYKCNKAESKTHMKETEGKYFFFLILRHPYTVCKKNKKSDVCELSQRASARSGPVSCWRTGNVPLKLNDSSWTSLSHAEGESLFEICSSLPNARKHFPSSSERLRRAWAEEFQRSAPTSRISFPHSTFTPSALASYRSAPLPGVLSAVCSPELFTSVIMDSGPDLSFPCCRPAGVSFRITNPHLAWEIWEWMFVLDLALVGWNRPRELDPPAAAFWKKWKLGILQRAC